MRVISLTQPWATLMALGEKRWETRSWKTPHRGLLAIHASKVFPKDCRALVARPPFTTSLGSWDQLPLGMIIAVVELIDCVETDGLWPRGAMGDYEDDDFPIPVNPATEPGLHEWAFGNYSDGRYAWMTRNVHRIEPIAAKGRLGLWEHPIPIP